MLYIVIKLVIEIYSTVAFLAANEVNTNLAPICVAKNRLLRGNVVLSALICQARLPRVYSHLDIRRKLLSWTYFLLFSLISLPLPAAAL